MTFPLSCFFEQCHQPREAKKKCLPWSGKAPSCNLSHYSGASVSRYFHSLTWSEPENHAP